MFLARRRVLVHVMEHPGLDGREHGGFVQVGDLNRHPYRVVRHLVSVAVGVLAVAD